MKQFLRKKDLGDLMSKGGFIGNDGVISIFSDDDDGEEEKGLLPSDFKIVNKTAAEIWHEYSDKLFAFAVEQSLKDPNGKLGVKVFEKIKIHNCSDYINHFDVYSFQFKL